MPSPSTPRRVLEIDALRFIAAMMVVLFHWAFRGGARHKYMADVYPPLLPAAEYGYLGVQLFFMISGFVILMSAQGRSPREFLVSRAVRLYPAFWACCTVTALAVVLFADPRFKVGLGQYLLNMTLLSDFLPHEVRPVDGAYWSLYVEIRFYLFVALIVTFGWLRHAERLLWLWLGLAALLQLAPHSRPADWLLAPYAALFVGGACCFLIHQQGLSKRLLLLLAASFVLAGYVSAAEAIHMSQRFAPYRISPIVAVLAIALFYLVMLAVATRGIAVLRHPRALALGTLTYPLYLLHENVGYMVFNRFDGTVPHGLLFVLAIAGALLLSWVVHRGVERPLGPWLKALLSRPAMAPAAVPGA